MKIENENNSVFFCTVLARAIHSLAKIGDELHIEPSPDGLILKTVNSSRSAYSAFKFHIPFFLNYHYTSESILDPNPEEEQVIKCKLPMKVSYWTKTNFSMNFFSNILFNNLWF